MREITSPSLVEADPTWSIPGLLAKRVARSPHGTVIERSSGLGGTWTPVTAAAFAAEVAAVAKGLVAHGIAPGDHVSIMSHTRYEWTVADFAIWAAGGVSVPVYETSSADQVRWVLSDSDGGSRSSRQLPMPPSSSTFVASCPTSARSS
jgi:long-chain acyl-CoA synthetase